MTITERAYQHYEPGIPHFIEEPTESLYSILVESASFYPERPAINYFGTRITYRELLDMVNRAASVLHQAGVRRGDAVAVCLPNCPQHLVAFYALTRLGAACASHNPLAPAAEIDQQLARHGGTVAIAWENSAHMFDPANGRIKNLFTVDLTRHMPSSKRVMMSLPIPPARRVREKMRADVPASAVSFDREVAGADPIAESVEGAEVTDVAAILHTGGTNGVPKSVPLTHLNIGANAAQNLAWAHRLHEGAETFFSLLPYFHSFGLTFFMVCAVKIAANQVVLPKFDVDLCLDLHEKEPVTFFVGVPPMFDRIAQGAARRGVDISTIRYAISGAMPLPRAVAERWEELTGGIIVEGYGMTETSPTMTGSPINENRRHGSLGVPFPSTDMRLGDLTDPDREPDPGKPGEILVRGPQVFSGYLNAPEDNADAFTSDGYFRTGDIGTSEDGFIYLCDRRKELILSGGFNVYPSQVEAAIRTMPGVRDVAVVGMPTEDGEEVTAALTLDEGTTSITLSAVREWAEKSISHYALPRSLVVVTELPRSQIGKVLRRAVREALLSDRGQASSKKGDDKEN